MKNGYYGFIKIQPNKVIHNIHRFLATETFLVIKKTSVQGTLHFIALPLHPARRRPGRVTHPPALCSPTLPHRPFLTQEYGTQPAALDKWLPAWYKDFQGLCEDPSTERITVYLRWLWHIDGQFDIVFTYISFNPLKSLLFSWSWDRRVTCCLALAYQ